MEALFADKHNGYLYISNENIWLEILTKFNVNFSKKLECIKHTVKVAFNIDVEEVFVSEEYRWKDINFHK